MPTLAEVRAKYPQYNDMPDDALASALHQKFYADMDPQEFAAKIGVAEQGNVGGLPQGAGQMDYAAQSMQAADIGEMSMAPPRNIGMGGMMLEADQNTQSAARQRVDPYATQTNKALGLGTVDDADQVWFKGPDGQDQMADKSKHVALTDPQTGQLMVYERSGETDEKGFFGGIKSFGRMVLPGLMTNPLGAASRAPAAVNTGQRAGAIANRAGAAVDDLAAFNRMQVPVFSPAFASTPARSVSKGLAETWGIGAPMQGAIENTYQGMANAANRTADAMSPTSTFDQAGATLQQGLDRFKTAGAQRIEPGVLASRGINPNAQVPPRDIMSAGAATRAAEAVPVRQANQGGMAQTARGVPVPAAQSRAQTLTARRSIEDMEDADVLALVRAPAQETSFATRAEALYENAERQFPRQMRVNETANPQLIRAVNTQRTFAALRQAEEAAQLPGGVVNGRFAGMADRVRTNVTLPTVRAMRSAVGKDLANFSYGDTGLDRTELKSIYAALSRDIEVAYQDIANRAHLATRAGHNQPTRIPVEAARAADRALYELRRADRYFRQGVDRIDSFLSVVGANKPEAAAQKLIKAATEGAQGDYKMFTSAMSALRPEERADFAALVLRELGKPVPSARGIAQEVGFSPSSFTTRYQKIDPRMRAMLFPGQHGQNVEDIFAIGNRLANVERFENVSSSGRMGVNVGGVIASGTALATGNILPMLAGAGGGFGLSYLLSRPAYARWAVTMLRLKEQAVRSPQALNASIVTHINKLAQMAQRDPELIPVLRAVSGEEGVGEGSGGDGGQEQDRGGQQPYTQQ
jgi:hypothetical protein